MPQTPEEILAQNLRRGLSRRNHWHNLTPEERKAREEALTARIEAERAEREKNDSDAPDENAEDDHDPTAAAYKLNDETGETTAPEGQPQTPPVATTKALTDADDWDEK